jgi:hypothetical protein
MSHEERKALLRQFAAEREAAKARILAVGSGMVPPPPRDAGEAWGEGGRAAAAAARGAAAAAGDRAAVSAGAPGCCGSLRSGATAGLQHAACRPTAHQRPL